MSKKVILVVDDEKDIVELVRFNLERDGFKVIPSYNGEDALILVKNQLPDLIILDLMLPGMDGLEVCRILKKDSSTFSIPIIMLTAKGEEADIVVGLELGADDYITKPFGIKEMIARVKTVLRRISQPERKNVKIIAEDLIIDTENFEARWKDIPLELTPTEFKLLLFLAQREGRVLTRQQLLDGVLGEDAFVIDRTVDVHIRRLRDKLKEASSYIVTRRGIGYMFQIDKQKP
ncbi:MAG: DNA-binding response regulator [Deltaproteobacteria bacterium]|nr:response regulator [Deltaproteobacteria bacterium]OQY17222.1 MAG: DNA-binding response regulator [Desulfobacterium sp. 4572_20]RLB15420.1 MAG: DNA-binding response regulator [Deltaproteobacteria bacterium]HDH87991.1 response regulator [Desulfobacteraceae bacterium]